MLHRHHDQRDPGDDGVTRGAPPSVRLLVTDADLRDAIARATAFERIIVSQASARAQRYAQLAPPGTDARNGRARPTHPGAS